LGPATPTGGHNKWKNEGEITLDDPSYAFQRGKETGWAVPIPGRRNGGGKGGGEHSVIGKARGKDCFGESETLLGGAKQNWGGKQHMGGKGRVETVAKVIDDTSSDMEGG